MLYSKPFMVRCSHHKNDIFWVMSKCFGSKWSLVTIFFLNFNWDDYHFKEFHILERVNSMVFWNQIWSVFQAVLYLVIYLVLQMSWVCHWSWTSPSKPDTASQVARMEGSGMPGWSTVILFSTQSDNTKDTVQLCFCVSGPTIISTLLVQYSL